MTLGQDVMISIGSKWEGDIYAGTVREGHLIVHAGEGPRGTWGEAMAWAAALIVGDYRGWRLPTCREQAVLFGNVPELFEKDWYWSNTQYEHNNDFAWIQSFGNGIQDFKRKVLHCRARAVRIESFS